MSVSDRDKGCNGVSDKEFEFQLRDKGCNECV
jgi:hypothetical protein